MSIFMIDQLTDPEHAGSSRVVAEKVRTQVCETLRNGVYFPSDYQPLQKASERYVRNHMDLNVLEDSQRFPTGKSI